MNKVIYIFIFLWSYSLTSFSQARLVLGDGAFITIGNSAYLVLDNPSSNALTVSPTVDKGNVISEGEYNRVKWNIGSSTGTYTVPFAKASGSQLPVTLSINSAGSAFGNIMFSTYGSTSWDNSTYMPSDVSNMLSQETGTDNSAAVIDRFWIIDANSYATKPSALLSLSYLDIEWTQSSNVINESTLGAQRWDNTNKVWDTYSSQGIVSPSSNTVTNISLSPTDFFRSWTLSSPTAPLPVELIAFDGNCNSGQREIYWTTASETNNDYFTLERTDNGTDYDIVGTVDGAGNSNQVHNYSFIDNQNVDSHDFYRLKQTDYDGKFQYSSIIEVDCSDQTTLKGIEVYPNPSHGIFIVQIPGENSRMLITDLLGNVILNADPVAGRTTIDISDIARGIYYINVIDGDKNYGKKLVID